VGSEDGVLSIYSAGNWGDCTDRYPGHPGSIDSILKIDETTIATGCSDGQIRIVNILPNKLLNVLNDHDVHFGIERMELSPDGAIIGSCGHDNMIHFWSIDESSKNEASNNEIQEVHVPHDPDDSDSDASVRFAHFFLINIIVNGS
jgi:WD repeat-containing protein 55